MRAEKPKPFFGWYDVGGLDTSDIKLLARLFSPRGDVVIGVYSDYSLSYWFPRDKTLTRSRIGRDKTGRPVMPTSEWIAAHAALGYRVEEVS